MRPLPRYVLAIMAAFVAFELWIPLLAIVLRALVGPTVPTAAQAVVPLFGLAVPVVVGLALSDYLADRRGLVRPYQPKRRPRDLDPEEEQDKDERDEDDGDPEEDREAEDDPAEEAVGEGARDELDGAAPTDDQAEASYDQGARDQGARRGSG